VWVIRRFLYQKHYHRQRRVFIKEAMAEYEHSLELQKEYKYDDYYELMKESFELEGHELVESVDAEYLKSYVHDNYSYTDWFVIYATIDHAFDELEPEERRSYLEKMDVFDSDDLILELIA
jgi:hypothetical protein